MPPDLPTSHMSNPGDESDGESLDQAWQALSGALTALGSIVVAFSGGTDSAFLAWAALQILGADQVLAVTAVSPSLASGELEHCAQLSSAWGLAWESTDTDELANPAYVANAGDRCYWCKAELMDAIEPVARSRGAVAVLGVNVDDLGDHRPGQKAAHERGAKFPLVDAGLTKATIRALSRRHGLSTWDRPAAACLASRLPYGTPVTLGRLDSVDRAEAALRRMGLTQLRVRHYDDTARIEVELDSMPTVFERRAEIVEAVRAAGYRYVTVDLEGFRSGNLNAALNVPTSG